MLFLLLSPEWCCISHMDTTWSHKATTDLVSQLRAGSAALQDLFFSTGASWEEKRDISQLHNDANETKLQELQAYRNQDLTLSLAQIQAVYVLSLNAAW